MNASRRRTKSLPHWRISVDEKMRSRKKLQQYAKNLLKYEPDYVFTHVTRLVPSKGLWRDLRVLVPLRLAGQQRADEAEYLVAIGALGIAEPPLGHLEIGEGDGSGI